MWNCFLEYTSFTEKLIEYECLCFNKKYEQVWRKVKRTMF